MQEPMTLARNKILCIQLRQIGDVLMTTPAVRALAESMPLAKIHFLTQIPSDQIFEYNPYVEKVFALPRKSKWRDWKKLLFQLRKEKYDIVIDFFGLPKTAFLSWLLGSVTRIGFRFRGRSLFYTHSVRLNPNEKYAPLHKMSLLSVLGIKKKESRLDFFLSQMAREKANWILSSLNIDDKQPLVSVSPVSRKEYKIWPAQKFAEICDYLVKNYQAQILFVWGPGEYHFVKAVRDEMTCSSLPDYDIPSISETVALLEKVDLHIGNDNGLMHFAIAVQKPTVSVFGRPLAENWNPPDNPTHIAIEHDPGCKRNCGYPQCEMQCIRDLPTEAVLDAVTKQMEKILLQS